MKNLKQFIGIYPVSKTLRFELRPIGRTQEWIEKNKVLENDENKAADYPVVKKLIDEYHKVCISLHPGLIVTGDWFVDSKEKMREIVGHFPEAKAVDMESAAIAQTCYLSHVPFISFRVISDIPLRDTDASQYHDFWNTIADNSFQVTKTFVEQLL